MNPEQLATLADLQLVDVRLGDDFEAAHIEGASNNCVFEVAFIARLPNTAPNTSQPTVVYGADNDSHEAEMAAQKLRGHGFTNVSVLQGGLAAAREAGLSIVEGEPLDDISTSIDGSRQIDLEESRCEWLGRNLINKHWGTAPLESGVLNFENGQLSGGEFVIDLTRLECTDLAGKDSHDALIGHLHSDDFFDVENFPKATFIITQVIPAGDSPGSGNLNITGDLTLRGQTHSIDFTASAGFTDDGKPAAQAAFAIDRTRWNILYGSGKFFKRLAGHVVNDMLEFQLRILTK